MLRSRQAEASSPQGRGLQGVPRLKIRGNKTISNTRVSQKYIARRGRYAKIIQTKVVYSHNQVTTCGINGSHRRRLVVPTSANGANGPVINTLLTLLVRLAIDSSFSGKLAGNDDHNHSRYADINTAIIPTSADFLARLGITIGSA